MRIVLFFSFILLSGYVSMGQITVNSSIPTQQLGLDELIGPGISTSLIQCTGDTTFRGTFYGNSNIGILEGIIMATADISCAITAPFWVPWITGIPGDTDLSAICGTPTYDAMVIEFDFQPATDSIEMSFVFASNEYPDYVCSPFNDLFAFLLSGPNPDDTAYNKTNIALIPGTLLPIAINTINSGTPGDSNSPDSCLSLSYSSLYVENDTASSPIKLNGFTTELTIYAHVFADSTYHIKFAIANVGDEMNNSGIFIRKNSFRCVGMSTNAIEDNPKNAHVVFPNPASSYLTLENHQDIQMVEIISSGGIPMKTIHGKVPAMIDLASIPNGSYFVRITSNQYTTVSPLIISH